MARLNYTSRDYAALLAELRAEAQRLFPDWTDFNEANAGNALLGAMALQGDILNANQDAQFNEAFWDTARHRASIISQGKLLGYKLASAKAATVTIQATIPATAGGVTIPKGTKVYTVGLQPVRVFELQGDITIPAGQTTGSATAKHAETMSDSFTTAGAADQRLTLTSAPYLDKTAKVKVDGVDWTEVDNFVGSRDTDSHFTVEVDEDDKATLVFGDGVNGAKPTGAVSVTYEIGGGVTGNVPANTIKLLDAAFTDNLGAGVTVTVTNPAGASGGEDREPIERARKLAPYKPKGTTRTVSRDDYEQNSLVTGIVRAKAVTQTELPSLQARQVGVYIIPSGGGAPTQAAKDAARTELLVNKPVQLGTDVVALDPTYKTINVNVTITAKAGADKTVLQTDAENAIRRWFDPTRTDATEDDPWQDTSKWSGAGAYALTWGMTVYQSHLLALLFRDPQARVFNVAITAPAGDTVCGALEFPTLGTLTVVVN